MLKNYSTLYMTETSKQVQIHFSAYGNDKIPFLSILIIYLSITNKDRKEITVTLVVTTIIILNYEIGILCFI